MLNIKKVSSRLILLYILVFTSYLCNAQWYDPDKVNKKAGEIYGRAYEAATAADYTGALKLFQEALALEPKFVDVFLSRAGIYAELKNYAASVADFETGMRMDSVYSKTYLLPYSISLAGVGKFQQALDVVNEFLATPNLNAQSIKAGNYRKSTYTFAVDYEKKHPAKKYVFAPKNLGDRGWRWRRRRRAPGRPGASR
jgi:tetratricopeptide (TPR) repeat protein